MARVSIYVSDELRAQMNALNDALNWSDIARPAFEQAIANQNRQRTETMSAIERLKESKKQYEDHVETNGSKQGRKWAENTAAYVELRNVAKINLDAYESDPSGILQALKEATDPDDTLDWSIWTDSLFGYGSTSNEWAYHFARGAQAVFEEVKDAL